MLHTIFQTLYDEDVLVEDAFIKWEENNDPASPVTSTITTLTQILILIFQEGKGVALKSCTQFILYIKEGKDEDEEDGE